LPTIKFYIREGLLPAGQSTGKNQAEYSEEHFERLALIRSLREDAALSVEVIARALRAADSARTDFVVAAIDAIERPQRAEVDEGTASFGQCHAEILALCKAHRWQVTAADTSVGDAARALTVIQRSFPRQGRAADGVRRRGATPGGTRDTRRLAADAAPTQRCGTQCSAPCCSNRSFSRCACRAQWPARASVIAATDETCADARPGRDGRCRPKLAARANVLQSRSAHERRARRDRNRFSPPMRSNRQVMP